VARSVVEPGPLDPPGPPGGRDGALGSFGLFRSLGAVDKLLTRSESRVASLSASSLLRSDSCKSDLLVAPEGWMPDGPATAGRRGESLGGGVGPRGRGVLGALLPCPGPKLQLGVLVYKFLLNFLFH
jgi:hypothetical protein